MSLETIKSKKGYLSGDQNFLPICSRFIERDKPEGINCKGPKDILTITVEVE